MKKRLLFFDLDGTLTDPGEGTRRAVCAALERFGIRESRRAVLDSFIGPPLAESFRRHYGFGPDETRQAVAAYRGYYEERGWAENVPYRGIRDALEVLRSSGCRMVLASSKPERFAGRILGRFGLREYFGGLVCASLDGSVSTKEEVLALALGSYPPAADEEAFMIGDRDLDVLAGKRFGLRTVGAVYGYGGREELERAGADLLAGSPSALTELQRI